MAGSGSWLPDGRLAARDPRTPKETPTGSQVLNITCSVHYITFPKCCVFANRARPGAISKIPTNNMHLKHLLPACCLIAGWPPGWLGQLAARWSTGRQGSKDAKRNPRVHKGLILRALYITLPFQSVLKMGFSNEILCYWVILGKGITQ